MKKDYYTLIAEVKEALKELLDVFYHETAIGKMLRRIAERMNDGR